MAPAKPQENEPSASWITPFAVFTVLIVGIALAALVAHLLNVRTGLLAVGKVELTGVLAAWSEAGQPEGASLEAFLTEYSGAGVFATNSVFVIDNQVFGTKFGTTRIGMPGALLITTNRALILVQPGADPEVIEARTSAQ